MCVFVETEKDCIEEGAGIVCALQCDKMGVKWNSRFKKERGLDFGETRPSGSERHRDGGSERGGEVMRGVREREREQNLL